MDDTDELLELIAKSDRLRTPRRHNYTPAVLMYDGSRPGARSPSPLSGSDTPSDKSSRFSDEFEAYTNFKVKGNFTPAPVVRSSQPHLDKPTSPPVPKALKELVDLVQG